MTDAELGKLEVKTLEPMGGAHVLKSGAVVARFALVADAHKFAAVDGLLEEVAIVSVHLLQLGTRFEVGDDRRSSLVQFSNRLEGALAAARVPEGA